VEAAIVDQQALVEYRYRAVRDVLGGSPIGEVAVRYGTTRQSLHAWRRRFEQQGMAGLADRSRRPANSPTRLSAEIEALICQLRRAHPRWGARRIRYELDRRDVQTMPSRATVHRVLTRNGLVDPQAQQHKRQYKRWSRAAPMHLWQIDIVGGLPLADGRELKVLTGLDDHSRFVVIAAVLAVPSSRAVCEAFTAAMRRYGVPSEVLTDNGGQFSGRHHRPQPVEVLFERICRENGITQRRTKPRSPTTTGKIERFHRTLREEFLNHVAPFESAEAAQTALDGWVSSYNYQRPHQALDMAIPASLFRPNGPTRLDVQPEERSNTSGSPALAVTAIEPAPPPPAEAGAVEFEARVPPSGQLSIRSGQQTVALHEAMAGRTVTVWADQRSVHVSADGHLVRTVASRLRPEDLRHLTMRGARPAGPAPAKPALRRVNGTPVLDVEQTVEIERTVSKHGTVTIDGTAHLIGSKWAGRKISLRLDATSCTPSPTTRSSAAGPARSHPVSSPVCTEHVSPPRLFPRRHYRPDRCGRNARSTPTARSWSPSKASNSVLATPARSSLSSLKTRTFASCTARRKSPSGLDAISPRSLDFTSPAPAHVKQHPTTIRQGCPEPSH
jgi:transposase InsO family protein